MAPRGDLRTTACGGQRGDWCCFRDFDTPYGDGFFLGYADGRAVLTELETSFMLGARGGIDSEVSEIDDCELQLEESVLVKECSEWVAVDMAASASERDQEEMVSTPQVRAHEPWGMDEGDNESNVERTIGTTALVVLGQAKRHFAPDRYFGGVRVK